MSPNGSVSRNRLPCFRTWTLPRSVACWIGTIRGSTKATPVAGADPSERAPALARPARLAEALAADSWSPGGSPTGVVSSVSVGVEAASGCCAIGSSGDRCEPIRLVGHDQRVDQPVDLAIHDPWQGRQVEPDPVVGHPVLGEVVGPDLVGAIARADHR